jgi:hypothetical protein
MFFEFFLKIFKRKQAIRFDTQKSIEKSNYHSIVPVEIKETLKNNSLELETEAVITAEVKNESHSAGVLDNIEQIELQKIIPKMEREITDEQENLLQKYSMKTISFSSIPDKFKDKSFCLRAVQINGHALMFVPQNIIDEEICVAAVKNNRNAIKHVPMNLAHSVKGFSEEPFPMLFKNDDSDTSIQELMEEFIPGKEKDYGRNDYHSHDGGSLYDQYEHIQDNL